MDLYFYCKEQKNIFNPRTPTGGGGGCHPTFFSSERSERVKASLCLSLSDFEFLGIFYRFKRQKSVWGDEFIRILAKNAQKLLKIAQNC